MIGPTDAGAAKFTAHGTSGDAVIGSITSNVISLTCTTRSTCHSDTMNVDHFSFGGDMNGSGEATFSSSGQLTNLLIGATLTIGTDDEAGDYSGTGTFRLVYQ